MATPGDKNKDVPPSVADAPKSVASGETLADKKKDAKMDKMAGTGTLKEVADKIETLTEEQKATTSAVATIAEKMPKPKTAEEEKEKAKGFQSLISGIKKAILGMSAKKALGGFLGGVFKVVKTIFNLLKVKFLLIAVLVGGFIATLPIKKLKEIWASFKDAMVSLYEMLAPIIEYLWNWLTDKVFPNVVEWFINTFKSITEMFKSIKERFAGWSDKSFMEKVYAIFGVFKDIGEAVWNIVKDAVVKVATMLGMDGEFWLDLWDSIKSIFNTVVKWMKETFTWENIKSALTTAAEKIINFGKWFYDLAIVPVVNWFKETFTIEKIKGALSTAGEKIMNFGKWFYDIAIVPVVDWLKETFTWDNIVGAIRAYFAVYAKVGKWIWDNALKPVVDWLKEVFTWDNIVGAIRAYFEVYAKVGKWIWDNALKPVVDWLVETFNMTKIKDTLSSLGAKIMNFGKWIYEIAVEPIIDWFKKLFDIDWGAALKSLVPDSVKKIPIIGKFFGGDDKEATGKVIKEIEKEEKEEGGLFKWGKEKLKKLKQAVIPKDELAQLKTDEGFRSSVYEDTMGIKTVGYGFNLEREGTQDALKNAGIEKSVADLKSGKAQLTEEEASQLMLGEMGHFKLVAQRFVGEETWNNLSGNRQGIITNMAYNMGEGTLNKFKKLQAAIRSGDWQEAQVQMADSSWAKQVKGRADRLIARMGTNDTGVQLAAAGAPGGGAGGGGNVIIAPSNVSHSTGGQTIQTPDSGSMDSEFIIKTAAV